MRHGTSHEVASVRALAGACLVWALGCAPQPEPESSQAIRYYQPPARSPIRTESAALTTDSAAARCSEMPGRLFPASTWVNRSVAAAARARDSDATLNFLATSPHGPGKFQVDFSMVLLEAQSSTPRRKFKTSGGPDCDRAPVPIPPRGRLEGERGYACGGDGACRLLVLARHECRLYEMFRANLRGNSFDGECLAVWDLAEPYPAGGRGDDCSSADAAGLPIAPLLFGPEDIARGEIPHALRFVLPNSMIRRLAYIRPGTHSTKATEGPDKAPPYATLLRLKSDIDLAHFKPAARVVLKALQNYGMYLADGGQITFTAASDATSELKWSDVGFGPHDLEGLHWMDFEVVDTGEPRIWQGSCSRKPVTE